MPVSVINNNNNNNTAAAAFANVLKRHGCTSHSFAGPEALKAIAAQIIVREQLDDTFFIVDLMNARRLHSAWTSAIPRVKPFYAMKCCPEPACKLIFIIR